MIELIFLVSTNLGNLYENVKTIKTLPKNQSFKY